MRVLSLTLRPDGDPLYDVYRAVADGASARTPVHVQRYGDGTVVGLCRLAGGRESVTAALAAHPGVLEYDVADDREGTVGVSLRGEPAATAAALHEVVDRRHLVVDLPVWFDGPDVRARVIGGAGRLRAALDDLPADVRTGITVDRIRGYVPGTSHLRSLLTDRQRAALDAAVELGYYDTPRRATAADVAAELGCARSTASEHLRKAEARVLSRLGG
ncbi:helix-turn-helix domain-containing protein [Halegenticoccus tardaugens]|uniref:helix-turn-helix domain-containing protein n=1 Tax=Halegenticoccus tardaugens TaxID=2071624 RepID=UPI00100B404C|nr:helix-turn-helix domain-containing protein [Halegenticoccus tardaugens]